MTLNIFGENILDRGIGSTCLTLVADGELYTFQLSVEPDPSPMDPLHQANIYGFSKSLPADNFSIPDKCHHASNRDEAFTILCDALEAEFGEFFLLGYFEHTRCSWHLSGEHPAGTSVDYRWDGTDPAGVWVPNDKLVQYAEEEEDKKKFLKKRARQDCREYTHYCNGDMSIMSYELRPAAKKEGEIVPIKSFERGEPSNPVLGDTVGDLFPEEVNDFLDEIERLCHSHFGEITDVDFQKSSQTAGS